MPNTAYGADAEADRKVARPVIPDPQRWGEHALRAAIANLENPAYIPRRLVTTSGDTVVTSSFDKASTTQSGDEFATTSFLELVQPDAARVAMQINFQVPGPWLEEPKDFRRQLMLATRADLVLNLPKAADSGGLRLPVALTLQRWGELASSELVTIASLAAPSEPFQPAELGRQLQAIFGYQGVILAQRGPFLVALTPNFLGAQGADRTRTANTTALPKPRIVAVAASAASVTISKSTSVALAALSLVASKDRFSILRLSAPASRRQLKIPCGTKLVITGM